jgi:hypothetical protein
MDAMIAVPVAPCHATKACLAEKSPLTNRIRRQFARIKAVRTDRSRSWLPQQAGNQATSDETFGTPEKGLETSSESSEHFEDESQETSGP